MIWFNIRCSIKLANKYSAYNSSNQIQIQRTLFFRKELNLCQRICAYTYNSRTQQQHKQHNIKDIKENKHHTHNTSSILEIVDKRQIKKYIYNSKNCNYIVQQLDQFLEISIPWCHLFFVIVANNGFVMSEKEYFKSVVVIAETIDAFILKS